MQHQPRLSLPCSGLVPRSVLLLPLLLLLLCVVACGSAETPSTGVSSISATSISAAASTNTWVVLVSTSRYWFNYRHTANALSIYRIVKAAGVPDSNILLLLPDDYACQPRNGPHAASMFNSASHSFNLYSDDDVEVDYRGAAVTVESLLRLLTGRHSQHTAKRQRLLSDERSNVLLYLSGHGGNEFLKFQDAEELSSTDIGLALRAAYGQRRFHQLLLLTDTCQAESLHKHIDAPGVLSIAASRVGENSYSSSLDSTVGLALIDRFTDSLLDFFEQRQQQHAAKTNSSSGSSGGSSSSSSSWMSRVSVGDLVSSLDPGRLLSHPTVRSDLFPSELSRTPLTHFFAADHQPHISSSARDAYRALTNRSAKQSQLDTFATSTPTAAVRDLSLSPSVHSDARVALPSVSSASLRRQLRSAPRLHPQRPQSVSVWLAAAALACVAAPLLAQLIERST